MKQTFDFTEIQSCNQITYLSEERIKSTAVPNVASLKNEYLKPFSSFLERIPVITNDCHRMIAHLIPAFALLSVIVQRERDL